jgi:hypothetical protein
VAAQLLLHLSHLPDTNANDATCIHSIRKEVRMLMIADLQDIVSQWPAVCNGQMQSDSPVGDPAPSSLGGVGSAVSTATSADVQQECKQLSENVHVIRQSSKELYTYYGVYIHYVHTLCTYTVHICMAV